MSEFFESEIVREELDEINKMQQEIYSDLASFGNLSPEERVSIAIAILFSANNEKINQEGNFKQNVFSMFTTKFEVSDPYLNSFGICFYTLFN